MHLGFWFGHVFFETSPFQRQRWSGSVADVIYQLGKRVFTARGLSHCSIALCGPKERPELVIKPLAFFQGHGENLHATAKACSHEKEGAGGHCPTPIPSAEDDVAKNTNSKAQAACRVLVERSHLLSCQCHDFLFS
jgi:hypothetical protein